MEIDKEDLQKEKKGNGLVIGRSKLFNIPNQEFYLIACLNCGHLFNSVLLKEKIRCVVCGCELRILNYGEVVKLMSLKSGTKNL